MRNVFCGLTTQRNRSLFLLFPKHQGSPPIFLSKSPSDLCPPGVVSIPQHASTSELGGSPLWVGTQSQVPDVVCPQGRWQPRDLVDAPGLVVTGTKNERETPEEKEVGGWGPETGASRCREWSHWEEENHGNWPPCRCSSMTHVHTGVQFKFPSWSFLSTSVTPRWFCQIWT